MSSNTLYIPKTLNVGYQERDGTYTGKLAYVVYFDDKGKLRKETSWRSWCSNFIGEIQNEPMDGFVLNRGVGGNRYSYGWNARNEYIRVYDPRGWEIEISVANLLFILQECTSTKGKGLEGEFVYSWSGTELVLLPVGSEEYKKSTEFTKDQSRKVTRSDMVEGKYYKFKSGSTAVYLGRHECCQDFLTASDYKKNKNFIKQHVFYDESTDKYVYEKGFTRLASVGELCESFADYLEEFVNSWHCNKVVDYRWEVVGKANDIELIHGQRYFIKYNSSYHFIYLTNYSWYNDKNIERSFETIEDFNSCYYGYAQRSKEFLYGKTIVKPIFILENGKEIENDQ